MKKLIVALLLCASVSAYAQTGSEILLFDIKLKKSSVVIDNPKNVTNHPGYDNQPFFHPDKTYLYYSSFDAEDRADLKRYDFKLNQTANITITKEREYSPTVTPDKQFLSCIIQRDNGAQDLGKYPIDGGDPHVIIDNLVVGYHVWADNSHLAMFVLGAEGKPHTLHYMRLPTKEDTILATNIGRSLHKVPGKRAFTYIQKLDTASQIIQLDTESMTTKVIANTLANGDLITWSQDGRIISSDGKALYFLWPKEASKGWKKIEVASGAEMLKSISRIAISADGSKLAVVVAE